jgi:hypothetical protein
LLLTTFVMHAAGRCPRRQRLRRRCR